jgi:hypothetical protein
MDTSNGLKGYVIRAVSVNTPNAIRKYHLLKSGDDSSI